MSEIPRLSSRPGATVQPPARALRVLLADDDRDATLSLSTLLKLEGYDVRHVYDGSTTLELAREFEPDVILLDIGMPKLTGYDVARAVRAEYGQKGPVLIALTGWKQASDKILATLAGFDHHVAKPYDPAALLGLISRSRRS